MLSSDALMAALTAEYERRLEVNHASLVGLFTAVDTNADWTINRVGQGLRAVVHVRCRVE